MHGNGLAVRGNYPDGDSTPNVGKTLSLAWSLAHMYRCMLRYHSPSMLFLAAKCFLEVTTYGEVGIRKHAMSCNGHGASQVGGWFASFLCAIWRAAVLRLCRSPPLCLVALARAICIRLTFLCAR